MSKKIIYFFLTISFTINLHSVIIDGELSEPEWQKAKSFTDFLTIFPDTLASPKYKTEAKYFASVLYFGGANVSGKIVRKSVKDLAFCHSGSDNSPSMMTL